MLWKKRTPHHPNVGKARIDSVFCVSVFHTGRFSTGVGNFVENDTHSMPFVGIESDAVRCISHLL